MVTKLSRRATDMRKPINALAEEGHVPPRQTWPTGCCDRSVDAQWTRGVCEQAHRRSGTETGGTIYRVEVEDSLSTVGSSLHREVVDSRVVEETVRRQLGLGPSIDRTHGQPVRKGGSSRRTFFEPSPPVMDT